MDKQQLARVSHRVDAEKLGRIRRRIEDVLRKTADDSLLIRIAKLLNVKLD